MSTMTITDLVDRCTLMSATHRRLFELVGSWVADEPDPARQHRYATAAHRHAWHADLWDGRRPAVPVEPSVADPASLTPPDDAAERAHWYDAVLTELIRDTTAIAAAVDPVLDPGTMRVAQLVTADLAELRAG